jgi:predicted nucleic acid-binding protein
MHVAEPPVSWRVWEQTPAPRCFIDTNILMYADTAVDLHQTRSVSFYDALILASAHVAGCKLLYSEDVNAGEVVAGGAGGESV